MMRYFVFRDGEIIGQSLREGGAYSILLSNICRTTGTYAIMTMTDEDYQARGCEFDYRDAGNLNLTWDHGGHLLEVDQPLWTPEHIEAWRARQPYTEKYEPKIRHFYMDFFDKTVEGYCQGQTWNGWSVPYFTKSQMEAVMSQCNDNYDNEMDWHDGNVVVPCPDEEPYVWAPEIIKGVDEQVWSVGGMSWVWESEDAPHEENDSGEWVEVTS